MTTTNPSRSPLPSEPGAGARSRVAVAALAVLLAAADTYVVVLALPDMLAGVGVGIDQLQRGAPVVSGFLLGYVVVLALAGRLSDAVGRTPVLVGCLLLFAAGSLVTATASGLGGAVAGRVVQGLGAGGLVPPTLALVADTWPVRRRTVPLGLVNAAQEAGSVLGPLLGAVILALSGWRAIFWVNLVAGLVLAAVLARPWRPRVRSAVTLALTGLAGATFALVALPPDQLTSSVRFGGLLLPLASSRWTSPLAVAGAALAVAAVAIGLGRGRGRALVRALASVDVIGAALLAVALAGIVITFAGAEVSRSPVAAGWPFLLSVTAVAAAGFAVRQARAPAPLVPATSIAPRGAWGAMVVNLLVGAGLVAVLVNVPIFARVTAYPDSQFAAALVLLQFLVALPAGAVAGGWLSHRVTPGLVAAGGLAAATAGLIAMATWDADSVPGALATVSLVVAGLGFGVAIAPVTAVLLAVTPPDVHGIAGALAVLARTVGMLVGLSALTAIGLRVFYARQAGIGTPDQLCPDTPLDCPAYTAATLASLVAEQQAIFAGAAVCVGAAVVLAAALLPLPGRSP